MLSANAKLVDTAKIKSNLHKPGTGVNSDVAKRMLDRMSQKKKKTGGWFHKEEAEQIDELSSELLSRYKEGAKKSADELSAQGKHKKAADRWLGHMKATGKQIDKTTANIKKALRREETEEQGMDRMKQLKKFKEIMYHLGEDHHIIPNTVYLSQQIPIAGCAHQAGTLRFGKDPKSSVLDLNCKAHGIENLYCVDTSFFPSIGAVNPSLTAIANALRVADHLKETF